MRREWSRRDVLRECLAGGVLLASATWAESDILAAFLDEQGARAVTPHVEMGPFYKKRAPATPMLRMPGDKGMPLAVGGKVISTNGDLLRDAKIEIWQANDGGLYDLDGYR